MIRRTPIKLCRFCTAGRATLFTSTYPCDRCGGTGWSLSDVLLTSPPLSVRGRKRLQRLGVRSVAQLAAFLVAGGFRNFDPCEQMVRREVRILARAYQIPLPEPIDG